MQARPSIIAVLIAVTGCGGTSATSALPADSLSQLTCLDWNTFLSASGRREVAGLLLTRFLDEVGWDYPVTPEGSEGWSKLVSAECGGDPVLWPSLGIERLARQVWHERLRDNNP